MSFACVMNIVVITIMITIIFTITINAVGVQGLAVFGFVWRTKTMTPEQAKKHQYNPGVIWKFPSRRGPTSGVPRNSKP